jgi:apolipoprotein N-acyltransferase
MIGYGVWLIVLGVLGASSIIIAKKPEAKEVIAKLAPYQGWIGACSALGGVWELIYAILHLDWIASSLIVAWITIVAIGLLQLSLGLILGIGVLKTFIKNPEANKRMDQTLTKLLPYQGKLGLVAIGVGGWSIVASILF